MAFVSRFIVNTFLLLMLLNYAPPLVKSIASTYEELLEPHTKVGLISIKGCLEDSTTHAKNLKKFFERKDIQAILIKMDSPGGAAGASQALFNEIKEAKKVHMKPVVVWVQNVCASGGYYIACASDHIIASPASLVGSIGAYIAHPAFKKFIEQFKIQYTTSKAGTYKTAGNPLLDLTPEQEVMFKSLVDDIYLQFTHDVAQQRPKLSLQKVSTWADGRIFTGAQALELGLIDELGSQITVEQYLKQKINVENKIEWVRPTCKSQLMQLLSSNDCEDAGEEKHSYISAAVHALCSYAETGWNVIAR